MNIKKGIVRKEDGSFSERADDNDYKSVVGQSYGLQVGVKTGDIVGYGDWGDDPSSPIVCIRSRAEAPDIELKPGEVALYREEGEQRIHFKENGDTEIRNENGTLTLLADGNTHCSGDLRVGGDIVSEKDIKVAGLVDGVKVSAHIHGNGRDGLPTTGPQ